jgi:hypothetical protein
MEFQLEYLDDQGQHLDVNNFNKLKDAMDAAESCTWAEAFLIFGMGQKLRGVRKSDRSIEWLGC